MTFDLLKMNGKVQLKVQQDLDGRFGVMVWKSLNLPTFNKWLAWNVSQYPLN